MMRTWLGSSALCASLCACIGVTEGGLVEFEAAVAGPADARGGPLEFATAGGYSVTLRRATLHVGALYLNRTVPLTSERESSCVSPGTYVGQVLSGANGSPQGIDVDLLRAEPTVFPNRGTGLADRAVNGEVWLTGTGNVSANEDKVAIFSFEGEARRIGKSYPFVGRFTIGSNRAKPPRSAALPGSNPICQERIVTGIPTDLRLQDQGRLLLRADPRVFFADVDFGLLDETESGIYEFLDREEGQPSTTAFFALRSSAAYSFSFE